MNKTWAIAIVVLLASLPAPAWARVMEGLVLEDGRTDENQYRTPVIDAVGIAPISFGKFESNPGPGGHIAYLMHKSQLTAKPKYKTHYELSPSIDLGAAFVEALHSESNQMGFSTSAQAGWKVSGTLNNPVLEIRPSGGGWGPLIFYGYMELELTIEDAEGNTSSERMTALNMSHHYNAGFGAQDEVREALARFLIEAAQEVVARLNRKYFKAPPHPQISGLLNSLRPDDDDPENKLRAIGLSGSQEAIPKLLELLEQDDEEDNRLQMINALALLGAEEAIPALARRYAGEDEDCRVFTLKALDYLGTAEARAVIEKQGVDDKHLPCRVIARRAIK